MWDFFIDTLPKDTLDDDTYYVLMDESQIKQTLLNKVSQIINDKHKINCQLP